MGWSIRFGAIVAKLGFCGTPPKPARLLLAAATIVILAADAPAAPVEFEFSGSVGNFSCTPMPVPIVMRNCDAADFGPVVWPLVERMMNGEALPLTGRFTLFDEGVWARFPETWWNFGSGDMEFSLGGTPFRIQYHSFDNFVVDNYSASGFDILAGELAYFPNADWVNALRLRLSVSPSVTLPTPLTWPAPFESGTGDVSFDVGCTAIGCSSAMDRAGSGRHFQFGGPVTVTRVPEPIGLVLFATGLVGLRAWKKRRQ